METSQDTFHPDAFEDAIYAYWEQNGYFKPDLHSQGKPFCMVKPPPNVTGALHMGHALTDTIEDAIVRYKRMKGFCTLFIPGTDHAGIATQTVVEKALAQEGRSRHDLGRQLFLKRVWEHKQQAQKTIDIQMRKMGGSLDWSRYCFTLDEPVQQAVRGVFCQLYREGLIYRGSRMISWCPKDETALSDLEVEQVETQGNMWRLKYVLADDASRYLPVETTRPETVFADTAVAVHPEDLRYKDWVGKQVIVPGVGRKVPVIADAYVDPKFGSGALKVTPGHDFNDYEIGLRHGLGILQVIDKKGRMNQEAGDLAGKTAQEARKWFSEKLESLGLVESVKEHVHAVGRSQRSGAVVEPMLSMQWFVKVKPLAEPAIRAVEEGRIKFIPQHWTKTYFEWMYNIRDWCISRQLWWGHQIPAFHCKACEHVTVFESFPQACESCGSKEIVQETDVLDTWFSSALWPLVTLGWPKPTDDFRRFYPNQLMETGFDIIFFWVARMIMFGMKFGGDVPFREVLLHAMVRDPQGQKMSKTKGNVVDPLDLVSQYGADALRFTLSAMAQQGRDVKLSKDRVEGYRNFMNKIWNANRFLKLNLDDPVGIHSPLPPVASLHLVHQWMLAEISDVSRKMDEAYDQYRLADASHLIYQFFWHEFCDWYLEFCKVLLKEPEFRKQTLQVSYFVFRQALKVLHPLAPFMTEHLYQQLPNKDHQALINARFPTYGDAFALTGENPVPVLKQVIGKIRQIRSLSNIPPSAKVTVVVDLKQGQTRLFSLQPFLEGLAKARIQVLGPEIPLERWMKGVVSEGVVYVEPPAGLNRKEELARLQKEIQFVQTGIQNISRKLDHDGFRQKAPAELVDSENKKLLELKETLEVLNQIFSAVTQI
jgi:valyl-tRNA synthetase